MWARNVLGRSSSCRSNAPLAIPDLFPAVGRAMSPARDPRALRHRPTRQEEADRAGPLSLLSPARHDVWTPRVVALEPSIQRSLEVVEVAVIPQVDLLVFEPAPEPFDEDVVLIWAAECANRGSGDRKIRLVERLVFRHADEMKRKTTTAVDERTEIRELTHRAEGSRQSLKPVERSRQRRQPKTGGSGGHAKKRGE